VGLLALHAVSAPQEAPAPPGEEAPAFSVAPDEDGWIGMAAVLEAFEVATGDTLVVDEETTRRIESTAVFASGPVECAAADARRVAGAMLLSRNFCWTVVRPASPRVLAIHSLDTIARGTARQDAPFVPIEQLDAYADSPGLLIQTLVQLPHIDVRVLSNSMRSMVVDPNTLQIIPVGNTDALILQGFAPVVADFVEMLRMVDRASAGEAAAPAARPPRLHEATGEATIPAAGEERLGLLELVELHAAATGQVALVDQETVRLLNTRSVSLSAPVTVAGDALATFCEELLREHDFVVTDLSHGTPCLYQVQSLDTTARGTARTHARYVDAGSLELCARRPATIFETVLELPHTDVRTLSNSIRSMVVDPNMLQIIPVGGTGSLIVQARGRELVELARMLRRVDAAAAENPDTQPGKAPEGEDR
jgi:hypothetical protein